MRVARLQRVCVCVGNGHARALCRSHRVPTDSNRRQTNTKHQNYFDSNKVPIGISHRERKPPSHHTIHLLLPPHRRARSFKSELHNHLLHSFFLLFFTQTTCRVNLSGLLLSAAPIIRCLTTFLCKLEGASNNTNVDVRKSTERNFGLSTLWKMREYRHFRSFRMRSVPKRDKQVMERHLKIDVRRERKQFTGNARIKEEQAYNRLND